jgi:septal ring factor EnvC (AmiA/AmiB activator)
MIPQLQAALDQLNVKNQRLNDKSKEQIELLQKIKDDLEANNELLGQLVRSHERTANAAHRTEVRSRPSQIWPVMSDEPVHTPHA